MFELGEDEKILLEIGPHSYFLIWPIFWSVGLSFLILGFAIVQTGLSLWFFVAFLICAGVLWTYALLSYFKFFRNRAFLTNQRLWAKRQIAPFKTKVKEVLLKDILEVDYRIEGFKAALFGFGHLIIKTSGGKIKLEQIPNPEKIKRQILNLRDHYLHSS